MGTWKLPQSDRLVPITYLVPSLLPSTVGRGGTLQQIILLKLLLAPVGEPRVEEGKGPTHTLHTHTHQTRTQSAQVSGVNEGIGVGVRVGRKCK